MQKLVGIPETMLIPLWARAFESGLTDPIIRDDKAVQMISRIDYDFSKFDKAWLSQVGVSVRTMLLDNAVRKFLRSNPNAVVINLGAGLDTRFERLKRDEKIGRWYDLDVSEAIELRRLFFTENDQNHFIAKSIFDFSWLEDVKSDGRPILVIAEGLFMYFTEEELKPLFEKIAVRLSGSEMLFEMLAPMIVGKVRHHDAVSKIGSNAEFKWGLRNSGEMETWHRGIKFVEEWNYYDYCKSRWRWFGFIGRLPLIGPSLANRIVHLRFE